MGCGAESYCAAGTCVAQAANGGACQLASQCTSGNCSAGTCCAQGQTACGGACVDLTSSDAHCGSCNTTCAAGTQACAAGHCLLVDAQGCTVSAACASGVCSQFFVDSDKDTYGGTATVGLCGITPPAGYATRGNDCCDSNAAINPGAGFQTTIGSCNGVPTWDFDCSNGTVEADQVCTTAANTPTTCGTGPCVFPQSACGTMNWGTSGCNVGVPPCICGGSGGSSKLGCK
jgi:hypothetical protein